MGIWIEVLGVPAVAVDQRFVELDARPELATRMLERVEQACGRTVPAPARSGHVSIAELAAALRVEATVAGRGGGRRYFARNVPKAGQATRPDLFFLHGDYNGGGFYCVGLAGHLGKEQPFHALSPHGVDGDALPASIEAMAEDQVARLREIRPRGPYRLGGHCNGALVAYEIARRLAAEGEAVERLLLVAPVIPGSDLDEPALTPGRLVRAVARRHRRLVAGAGPTPPSPPGEPATSGASIHASYGRIMRRYRPAPYAGSVAIFWPRDEPAAVRESSARIWRRAVPQARIRVVPGEHLTTITIHARPLAEAMRACLDPAD
jgi:Thioesterase domain